MSAQQLPLRQKRDPPPLLNASMEAQTQRVEQVDEKKKLAVSDTSSVNQEKKLRRRRNSKTRRNPQEKVEWPQWNTLRKRRRFCLVGHRLEPSRPLPFNLRIEPNVPGYNEPHLKSIRSVFEDTVACLLRIRGRLYEATSNEYGSKLQKLVARGITMAVYGSNLIDKTGCNFNDNIMLCTAVLANERVMYDGLSPRSEEYEAHLEYIVRRDAEESAYRSRREVVNHMAAFCYMANRFVGDGEELSEGLIKTTHRILCRGLDKVYANDSDVRSSTFAGRYRKEDVFVNTFKFPPHKQVKKMMRKFIKSLNVTIRQAEKMQELDPFYVAASASAHFVNIHPFLSGNGRICRIILNVILLKYAGIALAMGGDEKERKNYLAIAARRTQTGNGDGEMARFLLVKANRTMKVIERALNPD